MNTSAVTASLWIFHNRIKKINGRLHNAIVLWRGSKSERDMMWVLRNIRIVVLVLSFTLAVALKSGMKHLRNRVRINVAMAIENAPFDDIIPFLSEHIQPSDVIFASLIIINTFRFIWIFINQQLLFLGAKTDMSMRLSKAGYGTKKTGFVHVIDSDKEGTHIYFQHCRASIVSPSFIAALDECKSAALSDPDLSANIAAGKLIFTVCNLEDMPDICKQSTVDSIVDYGGLDSLLRGATGVQGALRCILKCYFPQFNTQRSTDQGIVINYEFFVLTIKFVLITTVGALIIYKMQFDWETSLCVCRNSKKMNFASHLKSGSGGYKNWMATLENYLHGIVGSLT